MVSFTGGCRFSHYIAIRIGIFLLRIFSSNQDTHNQPHVCPPAKDVRRIVMMMAKLPPTSRFHFVCFVFPPPIPASVRP